MDDNPDDRLLVLRELRREFPRVEAEQVNSANSLDEALDRGEFGLVITDYHLRWTNGIAVLAEVKTRFPDCPVIMFSATGNEEIAVEAMKHGLDDYVIKKSSHFRRLCVSARSVLKQSRTAQRAAELERRFESLLGRLGVGVFRCSVEWNLLEANDAFRDLLGITSKAKPTTVAISGFFLHREESVELLDRLLKTGQPQERDVQLRGPGGKPIWVRLSQTLTATSNGETVIDGIAENVTARKRSEEELRARAAVGARLALLSPREHEVMNLVVAGRTNKGIARRLGISVKTVEMHRSKMMKKLRVETVPESD